MRLWASRTVQEEQAFYSAQYAFIHNLGYHLKVQSYKQLENGGESSSADESRIPTTA